MGWEIGDERVRVALRGVCACAFQWSGWRVWACVCACACMACVETGRGVLQNKGVLSLSRVGRGGLQRRNGTLTFLRGERASLFIHTHQMPAPAPGASGLAAEVVRLQAEVDDLRAQLRSARIKEAAPSPAANAAAPSASPTSPVWERDHGLPLDQVERYSRQMLLPWFGTKGEKREGREARGAA